MIIRTYTYKTACGSCNFSIHKLFVDFAGSTLGFVPINLGLICNCYEWWCSAMFLSLH